MNGKIRRQRIELALHSFWPGGVQTSKGVKKGEEKSRTTCCSWSFPKLGEKNRASGGNPYQ